MLWKLRMFDFAGFYRRVVENHGKCFKESSISTNMTFLRDDEHLLEFHWGTNC